MSETPQKKNQQASRREEWSTNLDLDLLPSFLEAIMPLIDAGFGTPEAQRVFDMAKSMSVDEEKSLTFPIVTDGKDSDLVVRIFMDDIA